MGAELTSRGATFHMMRSTVMTPSDGFPNSSPDVSSEEDVPVPGTSGGELVNSSEQLSEWFG